MPTSRPPLIELIQRTRAAVASRMEKDTQLRRADAAVYARVLAGGEHELWGYLVWLSEQFIYDKCEFPMLKRWAEIWLEVPFKYAVPATCPAVTFAVQSSAEPILAGTVVRSLDGFLYETTADAVVSGTSAVAPIVARQAGQAGNRPAGEQLSLVSPLSGVQTSAIAAEISGGADDETPDELRFRLIARVQEPPQGGCEADYVTWALEVPGVTRAWCFPMELGPGTVTVRFVRDNDADIIPGADEVAAMTAYIQSKRPVTAILTVVAPIPVPINYVIDVTPDTPAVKQALKNEQADLLRREAKPGGTILLSHIRAANSAAAGEDNYVMSAPSADVVSTLGHMSVLGTGPWT